MHNFFAHAISHFSVLFYKIIPYKLQLSLCTIAYIPVFKGLFKGLKVLFWSITWPKLYHVIPPFKTCNYLLYDSTRAKRITAHNEKPQIQKDVHKTEQN